jgi:uncharacterized protein (DUF2461 family)
MCHMNSDLVERTTRFFAQLEDANTRAFWEAKRGIYDDEIRPEFIALLALLKDFTSWRVYRPHNDTRFHSGKGPYKTFIGAVSERADGVGAFIQISKRGVLIGTGLPLPATDQLPKLRAALADTRSGRTFVSALERVRSAGGIVHGGRWEPLKRVPKPFEASHVNAEYLRWKGIEVNSRLVRVDWNTSRDAAHELNALIMRGAPLHNWLATHVGPSALSAEQRFAPKKRA